VATDAHYRAALTSSDLNLTDSTFVLLVRLVRGHRPVARTSGLRYLQTLLRHPALAKANAALWVLPSPESMARNLDWLNGQGLPVTEGDCYVAPMYPRSGQVEDRALLAVIERRRPAHVFVCVGSGPQEKLGLYLKSGLSYTPGIHCVGAAIAFLSGDQTRIPAWADRLGLGWLARCVANPRVYVPRYARALRIAYLILRYDESSPPLKPTLE
jgi:UDP-N-acetyl-D-mannosaminuronic acid transferase (WecB/TagA/CpsF family)